MALFAGLMLQLISLQLSDPAHDLQALDRAFRFGEMRDVSVFRLLGAGSVEELI
jgi:SNF2 family DNA or RNA helicase